MSDTPPVVPPPVPPAVPPKPKRPGRFLRMLRWMRDHESDQAREYYANLGIFMSRVYAAILILIIPLISWLEPRMTSEQWLWFTLIWCIATTFLYLWYQGKEILAYPVIEERHANRDLMNSILPAISIAIMVAAWLLIKFCHVMGWMAFEFTYTVYGWVILFNAALNVFYDLRVNTRVTFVLSKVPARQEFGSPPSPH